MKRKFITRKPDNAAAETNTATNTTTKPLGVNIPARTLPNTSINTSIATKLPVVNTTIQNATSIVNKGNLTINDKTASLNLEKKPLGKSSLTNTGAKRSLNTTIGAVGIRTGIENVDNSDSRF